MMPIPLLVYNFDEHCHCTENVSQRRKIKVANFISLSCSVFELLRKNPKGEGGGRGSIPPSVDRAIPDFKA